MQRNRGKTLVRYYVVVQWAWWHGHCQREEQNKKGR